MSHELNDGKYPHWYHEGGKNALARSVIDGDDNLLRADRRPSLRRRVRKFLKLAAIKLGLL